MILKTGSLGFVCKRPDSDMKPFVMDIMKVNDNEKPLIVNLDFINRKRSFYEIKAMEYCIFHFLSYEKFIETINMS
jgi:hypothetical protein